MIHVFGQYHLCTLRRALFRDNQEVPLRRKAYECLRYLIEQSPRAVPKDELCEAVWSPRVISDETLASTIKDVRVALDDRGQPHRYVRTLTGFGYRFVALESTQGRSQVDSTPSGGLARSDRSGGALEHADA